MEQLSTQNNTERIAYCTDLFTKLKAGNLYPRNVDEILVAIEHDGYTWNDFGISQEEFLTEFKKAAEYYYGNDGEGLAEALKIIDDWLKRLPHVSE